MRTKLDIYVFITVLEDATIRDVLMDMCVMSHAYVLGVMYMCIRSHVYVC
jgi:hypothetical protein